MVGASLWAAQRIKATPHYTFAFPRYNTTTSTNANSASAAINKWLKPRVPEGCVIHSFRHSLRDRLRAVQCPSDIIDQIGGWSTAGVGQAYGEGYLLKVKLNYCVKILLKRPNHTKLFKSSKSKRVYKLRFFTVLILLSFIWPQSADAATTWLNPGQKNGLYAYDPQYENYKEKIETPLRHLKVFDNFTLIDDFEGFMEWHRENTSGKFPDSRFLIAYQSERGLKLDECLSNAKTLTGTSAVSAGISEGEFTKKDYSYQYPSAQARCQNVLSQRFLNNPSRGSQNYADILKYWVENNILNNINKTTKRIPTTNSLVRTDFVYATLSRAGEVSGSLLLS